MKWEEREATMTRARGSVRKAALMVLDERAGEIPEKKIAGARHALTDLLRIR